MVYPFSRTARRNCLKLQAALRACEHVISVSERRSRAHPAAARPAARGRASAPRAYTQLVHSCNADGCVTFTLRTATLHCGLHPHLSLQDCRDLRRGPVITGNNRAVITGYDLV